MAIGAVIGALASVYSASKAAGSVGDSASESNALNQAQFEQTREDLAPYREVGTKALDRLASLYGIQRQVDEYSSDGKPVSFSEFAELNGGGLDSLMQLPLRGSGKFDPNYNSAIKHNEQAMERSDKLRKEYDEYLANRPSVGGPTSGFNSDSFMQSPDYKFAYDQGNRAVEQSLARRGISEGGSAMKELSQFNQGLASQKLGEYKNSLAALAGIGQTSATTTGQFGANMATNNGQNIMQAGDARASSYLNQGSAINQIVNAFKDKG